EMKKSAEIIKNESNRIAIIIRQLLDFARRNTPKRTSIDMRQLVVKSLTICRGGIRCRRGWLSSASVC
ncbi:MAG TPA: hypothetical protein VMX74_15390, partial [Pirellulales bacterium]|nr:hypothetical protein [Pirellulales bacterium]